MASVLVLLTNYFPYFRGEEYLERELPHLIERFDRVLVVPTMRSASMVQTRALPEGAVLVDVVVGGGLRTKLNQLAVGLRRPVDERAGSWWRHPIRRAYEAYFEGRSQDVAARVDTALVASGIDDDDEVLIYSYWLYVTARVGLLIAENGLGRGLPAVVSRAHGYDINEPASPVGYLPARETLLRGLSRIFPVATYAANRLRAEYPRYANKIEVRRLGVVPAPPAGATLGTRMLVTCSTIRPLKRLAIVGKAVAQLREEGFDVRWTHLGWGAEKYARKTADSMRALLGDAVVFAGYVPNEKVAEHYAALRPTVFVNVSTSEGVPVSIMEAMRAGVPIIATDVGGTRELLPERHGELLLAADLDSGDLASALRGVFSLDPGQYHALSDDMRSEWAENWNADITYRAFADELIEILERRHGDAR